MICLICRNFETVYRLTSVSFERSEIKFTINNVPAWVCPSCGDAYVEEDVAVRLLQYAEEMSEAGMLDSEMEYQQVA